MNVKQSDLKIREEFNDCPGGDKIKQYIYDHNLKESFDYVDVEGRNFWDNDEATMVVALKLNASPRAMLGLGKLSTELNADEYDFFSINGVIVVRIWWD